MTTFEQLAHQKTKLLGQDIARLGQRIARQKKTITTQRAAIVLLDDQLGVLGNEIRRNEAIISGLQAQIAKLQGKKA